MPAPSEAAIVKEPRALNAFADFPFRLDEFPAEVLLGSQFANLAAREEHRDAAANPNRKEAR